MICGTGKTASGMHSRGDCERKFRRKWQYKDHSLTLKPRDKSRTTTINQSSFDFITIGTLTPAVEDSMKSVRRN
jgi:hypothetical protein